MMLKTLASTVLFVLTLAAILFAGWLLYGDILGLPWPL